MRRAQSMPQSWDAALRNTVVLLMWYFLTEFIRVYPRRLSRCHLAGRVLKAAAPSLHPPGRPAKANSGSTGSNREPFCCKYFTFYHVISMFRLVLALGMENVLCEGELQHRLYAHHIANAWGQVPKCSLCFTT